MSCQLSHVFCITGVIAVAAFSKERNVITVVNDDAICATVLGKLVGTHDH